MKKALLVGINNYPSPNELQGCVNDVTNVRDILIKYFGFESDNIRVLTDERATKANIMERLGWLVDDEKNFTKLFYCNSSHGSQIRDRNGDELSDGLDEIICPVDFNWDDGFISDDMLSEIFKNLPKGKLEVIMDSCHSGTVTRNSLNLVPTEVGDLYYRKARFILPPVDIQCRVNEDKDYKVKKLLGQPKIKDEQLNHVLYAGCRDNQTCADAYIGGSYNGAFTYLFCKTIRAIYDGGKTISRADLIYRVRKSLRYNKFDQIPQLECTIFDKAGHLFT